MMKSERLKIAMTSACRQFAYMCSLSQTVNTLRQQRVLDGLTALDEYKDEKRYTKTFLAAQWEYLKTMATEEDLEAILKQAKKRQSLTG